MTHVRVALQSLHPACVACKRGELQEWNESVIGRRHSEYYFVQMGPVLVQKKSWSFAYVFHYAKRYRYFGSTSYEHYPHTVNCIEFVQRVLHLLRKPRHLYMLPLTSKYTLYTAYAFWRLSAFRGKTLEDLDGATDFVPLREMLTILQSPKLHMYIVSVNHHRLAAVGAKHLCLIFASTSSASRVERPRCHCFSIALGNAFDGGACSWNDVYVSSPDPLLLLHYDKARIIDCYNVSKQGHLLLDFFKLRGRSIEGSKEHMRRDEVTRNLLAARGR